MKKRISFEQITELEPEWVRSKIEEFIQEDMPSGDITTENTISDSISIEAQIIAAEDFIFCGEQFISMCFPQNCSVDLIVKDGIDVSVGQVLVRITGQASTILNCERFTLNLTQRLCGIATETKKYCDLNLPEHFKIMDTRKTTPGLRKFEKYAVSVGGGWNHRLNLSASILLKDNHLKASGGIRKAIDKIRMDINENIPIELEVDTIAQLKEGLSLDLDGYLLDNMSCDKVKDAVSLIRGQKEGEKIFIEASGGIDYSLIESYAWTGVDAVSTSSITAKAPVVDIKMDFN
ncbi:MAG: carboxylating nicotinate-nucleotide diphosphorylase [Candidatus Neomarinimicrobiota bacterium]